MELSNVLSWLLTKAQKECRQEAQAFQQTMLGRQTSLGEKNEPQPKLHVLHEDKCKMDHGLNENCLLGKT
jgi:hypothetical protein